MPAKTTAKKPAAKKLTAKNSSATTTVANSAAKKAAATKSAAKNAAAPTTAAKRPALLSGGNPQIAKADGDAPVEAWIEGLPDRWKIEHARWLDTLIERTVPGVQKKVRWNSPMYGVEGQGFFLGFHAFKSYIKVNFFFGALLEPKPPVGSKDANGRYLHLEEGVRPDEAQVRSWIKQAAALPGWGA